MPFKAVKVFYSLICRYILPCIIVLVTTVCSVFITYGYLWHHSFVQPSHNTQPIRVIIAKNTSLKHVVQILAIHNVVTNPVAFAAIVRLKKLSQHIKAGEYEFPAYSSAEMVLDMMVSGKTVQHYITFAEGLASRAIVETLRAEPAMTGEITTIPDEGTVLPETYAYALGDDRQKIINRMQAAMNKTVQELWATRQENLPLVSPQQAIILASIVEKETSLAHERPLVAAVFINRLRKGMPLQADPTVIYALEIKHSNFLSRSLTRDDLKFNHPYNTYMIAGLTPGPICNPGRAALQAVLHPANNNNLYFVADGTGGHVFSETLQQHQHNHQQWRKIRDK